MHGAAASGAGDGSRAQTVVADDALIVFTPSGKRGRFPHGTPILEAARKLGADLDSVCGGRGICGRCQITVSLGDFSKHGLVSHADHLTPISAKEERYAAKRGLDNGRRLSCATLLQGDVVIDVPSDSQVHKQIVRKRPEIRDIELDPALRLHYVEVEEPDMDDPTGDLERLIKALESEWSLEEPTCDLTILQSLQRALRDGKWKVTVAVNDANRIIAVWPGFRDRAYGIAFDIGTTTIAAHLCDLRTGEVVAAEGSMNPQIRFGEDLMSRVSYAMRNPGGEAEMTGAVREAVNHLVGQVAAEAGIDRTDVLEAAIVGNSIMHHLLLGIDPTELGGAPFALTSNTALTSWANEIDLRLHAQARIYVLPCIAGHVGADTAGVILSEGPHLGEGMTLLVDVGTNAEIVLGNKDRLLAASSPAGPAFEGAQISCGQRAAPGAIESVRIDRETLEPRFSVIGCDLWSDEPGFAEATQRIGVTGICGSGIIEAMAEMFLAGIIKSDGIIDGDAAAHSERIIADGRTFSYLLHAGEPEIVITQDDVRQVQLAKAALHAGARLLMERMGTDTLDRITLTGAFGSQIDVTYAMVLGLIPDCDLGNVVAAGAAAGTGARIALLNRKARKEIEQVVKWVEKVEIPVEPRFQAYFIDAMAFPHATDRYAHLSRVVDLPAPSATPAQSEELGGRRRRGRRA